MIIKFNETRFFIYENNKEILSGNINDLNISDLDTGSYMDEEAAYYELNLFLFKHFGFLPDYEIA